jgi:hypothetical protein
MEQTPQEKAKELVDKFTCYVEKEDFFRDNVTMKNAKQCALIAVDLAIQYNDFHIEFLQEVKQEIENF